MGTWIEIASEWGLCRKENVVPFVGTWIEMYIKNQLHCLFLSFPSWERGLKFPNGRQISKSDTSFPSWERGLKSYEENEELQRLTGRSLRGNVD